MNSLSLYGGDFDSDMESFLIDEVRIRPFLWDINSILFTKKNMKRRGYEEIANLMREKFPSKHVLCDPEVINLKFRKLKGYYTREYRKWEALQSETEKAVFLPKWIHFNRLSFLSDCIPHSKKVISNSDKASFTIIEDDIETSYDTEEESRDTRHHLLGINGTLARIQSIDHSTQDNQPIIPPLDALNHMLQVSLGKDYVNTVTSVSFRTNQVESSNSEVLGEHPINRVQEKPPEIVIEPQKLIEVPHSEVLKRHPKQEIVTPSPECIQENEEYYNFPSMKRKREDRDPDNFIKVQTASSIKLQHDSNDVEEKFASFITAQLREITDSKQRDLCKLRIHSVLVDFKYNSNNNINYYKS